MDTSLYKEMVLTQLQDREFYKRIDGNKDKNVMSKISKLLKEFPDNLLPEEIDYLTNFEIKPSNFYI